MRLSEILCVWRIACKTIGCPGDGLPPVEQALGLKEWSVRYRMGRIRKLPGLKRKEEVWKGGVSRE